ncbi:hypothetical protein QBC34DRAFT_363781 [Podospora aff. communis PSN243]|uniref:Uncharacterized protein n=1 Tax=Podospora aff. communis PSN243 TaxID=3040156 RepID=A0AAV9G0B9_9PEZI|nr:hypothetical protein QBC34DRAFT_363781 [Podospora aff. communis PSN243]
MNGILSTTAMVDCLGDYSGSIQHCVPPTLWNPDSITTLSELRIDHLVDVIPYNQTYDKETDEFSDFACPVASPILPIRDIFFLNEDDATDTLFRDPASLSVGVLELTSLARQLFPYPLNESLPGDVVNWWVNATEQDASGVTLFLGHVARECWYDFCQSRYISIGNPDIVGYGMFISIVILLLLTLTFSVLSFTPISRHFRNPLHSQTPTPRFNLRHCLLTTLPHLLATTLVFTASVIISSYVYRWTTHSRFDALMADALSMLCATSLVMLCAAYWATTPSHQHQHQPWYMPASIVLLGILNTILFATHFSVFYKPGKVIERLCHRTPSSSSPEQTEFHNSTDFQYFLAGFIAWLLACVGLAAHYPSFRSARAALRGWKYGLWVVAEALPAVAGMAALAVYARYYWITRGVMKEVYGRTFLDGIKRWGFGQYLALATWGPPVLLFLYVYFVGEGRGEGGMGEKGGYQLGDG